MKTIYNLELHEKLSVGDGLTVQRVPGGWNYKYYTGVVERDKVDWSLFQVIFVPYNNEFQVITVDPEKVIETTELTDK